MRIGGGEGGGRGGLIGGFVGGVRRHAAPSSAAVVASNDSSLTFQGPYAQVKKAATLYLSY